MYNFKIIHVWNTTKGGKFKSSYDLEFKQNSLSF